MGKEHHCRHEDDGKDQLDTDREVIIGAVYSFCHWNLQEIQWVHQGIVITRQN
jgi:hypothetical protein